MEKPNPKCKPMSYFWNFSTKYVKSASKKRLWKHINWSHSIKNGISISKATPTMVRAESATLGIAGIDALCLTRPKIIAWSGHMVSMICKETLGCCDQKAWAVSVQSFTLWQQATIEIMCRNHSIIACLCHIYMGVILHAHPIRGESHI